MTSLDWTYTFYDEGNKVIHAFEHNYDTNTDREWLNEYSINVPNETINMIRDVNKLDDSDNTLQLLTYDYNKEYNTNFTIDEYLKICEMTGKTFQQGEKQQQLSYHQQILKEREDNLCKSVKVRKFTDKPRIEIIDLIEIQPLVFSSTIKHIGDYTFANCNYLTSITLPDSVNHIGNHAFENCRSLKSITLPKSIYYIGDNAFANCISLSSVITPKILNHIGDYAFINCSSLKSIILPESLKHINDSTFKHCTSLSSVTLPKSLNYIGDSAFENCNSLKSLNLSNNIDYIGNNAFKNCNSLSFINIPVSMSKIQIATFKGCSSLNSIHIPENIKIIDSYAFSYCSKLKNVILPFNIKHVDETAFRCSDNANLIKLPVYEYLKTYLTEDYKILKSENYKYNFKIIDELSINELTAERLRVNLIINNFIKNV